MKCKHVFSPSGLPLILFVLIVVAFQARLGTTQEDDAVEDDNPAGDAPEDIAAYSGFTDDKADIPSAADGDDKKTTTRAPKPKADESDGTTRNRQFDKNCCKQKIRTSYVTNDICGKAALCYWEIWNYRKLKSKALGEPYNERNCDEYMVQKYICLIGYPKPFKPHPACEPALQECDRILSRMLYADCEPLRQKRGLLSRPKDVHHHIRTKDMNFDLSDNPDKHFQPLPNSDAPTHNNFYAISCPIIYRYPFFTINLLLKDLDPKIEYDETHALEGVGAMLPQYFRVGMEEERKVNFEALALTDDLINWCGIPRNYICIKKDKDEMDKDPLGEKCLWEKLDEQRQKCEPDVPMPYEEPNPKGSQVLF